MSALPAPFPLPELARSLTSLPGVGPATARALAARGLHTWGDALFFFPRRYQDRRHPRPVAELVPGSLAVVKGTLLSSGPWGRRGKVYRMLLEDQSGRLGCLWFHFRKPQMARFERGEELVVVGQVGQDRQGLPQMIHPEVYRAAEVGPDHPSLGRLLPVYPQVEGVRPGNLRRIMEQLLKRTAPAIPDPLFGLLPPDLYPLPAGRALLQAHLPPPDCPDGELEPENSSWRRSLAVNELLYFELGLALKRGRRRRARARPLVSEGHLLRRFIDGLGFELTPGQKRALHEIQKDLARSRPMSRLLSGDVGTGKTVVAAAAVVLAAQCGVQSALMAPTEVLALQHHRSLQQMLEPLGVTVVLATGSQNGSQRHEVCKSLENGAPLVVGTHALLSRRLQFADLGLVIIDEQHRFGVQQRLELAGKAEQPHLLVLSATPIPRTLALALAGHLDISDLPEKPLATPPVQTQVLEHRQRRQALEAMEQALERGEQVYVICPLVEESGQPAVQDAVRTHRRLSEYFEQYQVGLLHGRLPSPRQQQVLQEFREGDIQVLVATTVVEVGVDVGRATLMVVLGADRFGLSQLHQLRGRVGRGRRPGRCILVSGPQPSELARQRLQLLSSTSDGHRLAEADLVLRGPGEALGRRQSGLPPFRVARWDRDAKNLPLMRRIIGQWLELDPEMTSPELAPLRRETLRRWGRRLGLVDAG